MVKQVAGQVSYLGTLRQTTTATRMAKVSWEGH